MSSTPSSTISPLNGLHITLTHSLVPQEPEPLNPSTLPPELLEQILLHLPQKDILLSQRTSRAFRQTTLGSPRLQKALFLLPDASPSNSRLYTDGKGMEIRKPENNRLLLRAFPGCYPTVTLVIVEEGREPLTPANERQSKSEFWSWDVCISFPSDAPPATHPSVLYPEASWRRMFLSQPPCTSLHLVRRWQRSVKPAIVRQEGIKMGEFVDEAGRSGQVKMDQGPGNKEVRRDSGVVITGDAGGLVGEGNGWSERYISSDRDWHFEGNIRCGDFGVARGATAHRERKAAEAFATQFQGYLFSRRSRNGVASAMGDEWDPGRAFEFGRVDRSGLP